MKWKILHCLVLLIFASNINAQKSMSIGFYYDPLKISEKNTFRSDNDIQKLYNYSNKTKSNNGLFGILINQCNKSLENELQLYASNFKYANYQTGFTGAVDSASYTTTTNVRQLFIGLNYNMCKRIHIGKSQVSFGPQIGIAKNLKNEAEWTSETRLNYANNKNIVYTNIEFEKEASICQYSVGACIKYTYPIYKKLRFGLQLNKAITLQKQKGNNTMLRTTIDHLTNPIERTETLTITKVNNRDFLDVFNARITLNYIFKD